MSIASELQRIVEAKTAIIQAITDKGVDVPEEAKIEDLAELIAEIGDIRRFHSGKALIAYAGIDAPPYQSGQFMSVNRRISKRGSSSLRKVGYEEKLIR